MAVATPPEAERDDLTRIADALAGVFRAGHAARLHERAAEEAGVSVDRTGFVLLVKVMEEPARISRLADRIGLDISTTSRKVAELEAAGLVVRARTTPAMAGPRSSRPPRRATTWSAACGRPAGRAFGDMLAGWKDCRPRPPGRPARATRRRHQPPGRPRWLRSRSRRSRRRSTATARSW